MRRADPRRPARFLDFSATPNARPKARVRTLDRLNVVRHGDLIEIYASARAFLHHQVRSMVGSLEHVGAGKWSRDDLKVALEARDRSRCGMVAPAAGLYFLSVDYPAYSEIPAPTQAQESEKIDRKLIKKYLLRLSLERRQAFKGAIK